jgi:hypothetical protein
MHPRDLLIDAFERIRDRSRAAVSGLGPDALAHRPDPDANPIGWLVWHLIRVQDDHVSEIAGRPQAWVAEGWAGRFGMDPDPADIGYGHSAEQVAAVPAHDPDLLVGYADAVTDRTIECLRELDLDDLDRIIDRRWDPPVSVGVRLVSVIGDDYQHLGQAHYLRGMLDRSDEGGDTPG